MRAFRFAAIALALFGAAAAAPAPVPHNVILFVPDGLRAAIVDETTAPNFAAVRRDGVDFANSHSIFPTFTTANASAFATGHYLGDTGDFSNVIYPGFPVTQPGKTLTPFLEQDDTIAELDAHFGGNYLNEESVLAAARAKGYSTAAIGKLGPVAIQDVKARAEGGTIIVDDATGAGGIPLPADVAAALAPLGSPPRVAIPNVAQQNYFLDVATKIVLPRFKAAGKPFVMVYWSRDPDVSQHGENDGHGELVPGINGPTALAGIANADANLRSLRAALDALGLAATTDIVVAADHGFATVAKESHSSAAAKNGVLPAGFLAIDLAKALGMKLYDPDGERLEIDPGTGKLARGNALLGADKDKPDVIVAANGGSDLIYLPQGNARTLAAKIVDALMAQDYVSGIFANDALGRIAGTLPLSAINLKGAALTPTPSLVVNFRSFDTGCGQTLKCAALISDSGLEQGHGMHGSFSRAETANFMAAIGPDFKAAFRDAAPVSNADMAVTIGHILGLNIRAKGKLTGRVAAEALTGGPATTRSEKKTLRSAPAHGLATVLDYQRVGTTLYFDAAGFPGRTVGLSP